MIPGDSGFDAGDSGPFFGFGDMEVNFGRLLGGVAEEFLCHPDIISLVDDTRAKAVAKQVWVDCSIRVALQTLVDRFAGEVFLRRLSGGGEQKRIRIAGADARPVGGESIYNTIGEGNRPEPFTASGSFFEGAHSYNLVSQVNMFDLQGGGFGDPEAGIEHEEDQQAVFGISPFEELIQLCGGG